MPSLQVNLEPKKKVEKKKPNKVVMLGDYDHTFPGEKKAIKKAKEKTQDKKQKANVYFDVDNEGFDKKEKEKAKEKYTKLTDNKDISDVLPDTDPAP